MGPTIVDVVEKSSPARAPVLVPFRCPRCAAEQRADLIALSRSGTATCTACGRRLSRQQVSEAIEDARRPRGSPPARRASGRLWA